MKAQLPRRCVRSHVVPRRAFALIEVVMGIAALLLVAACLLIAGAQSRQAGVLGRDMAKLRELGTGTYAFANDNQDQLWTFDWQPYVVYNTPWPDLNWATSAHQAAANQAVYILRSRGFTDLPRHNGWLPHVYFSHLVLADYLNTPQPWEVVVSAADTERLRWLSAPGCTGCFSPCHMIHAVRMFGSSFAMTTSWFDRGEAGSRVSQAHGNYNAYNLPLNPNLGPGLLSEVVFPSRKVAAHDLWARHFGTPQPLFIDPAARMPMLFVDGHARVRATADANPGWQPNVPANPNPTLIQSLWQVSACIPGTPGGGTPAQFVQGDVVPGVYRWTRGGLAGRDFAGDEINTGQRGGRAMINAEVPMSRQNIVTAD